MTLQVDLLDESFVAQVALIGPVPSVQVHVVLEVVVVHELGVAVNAQVGPLPRVLPHVDLQFVLPATQKPGFSRRVEHRFPLFTRLPTSGPASCIHGAYL